MVGYYQTESIPSPTTMSVTTGLPTAMPGIVSNLEPLTRTRAQNDSVKSLVCSPDLTVFSSESRPSTPPSTSSEEKSYRCLLCRKNFDQKSLYQSHLRSHGKEGEDPYRCNICGKTFAVPARLTRHYRTHTGEKPYQCEYCSKSFSVKENLSVHRRIHTKERPYKCDVCERAFEHSGKLHRHMRIHTGERPHKCTVCSKTFIQSGQLVIHMRTHTGEKPYVCKSCGKGFTCSKQLKVHTRTHTGEKPYTCDVCGKSFGYNHVLKLHQVHHYGEKVYKCTLCHETFGSKKTMEMHIKTHSDSPSGGTSPRDESPHTAHLEAPIETAIDSSPVGSSSSSSCSSSSSLSSSSSSSSSSSVGSTNLSNVCDEERQNAKLETSSASFSYYLYPRERYQVQGTDDSFQTVAVEPPRDFLYPTGDVVTYGASYATYAYSGTPYSFTSDRVSSLLDLPGNDARRRVEAALEAVEEESQRVVQREPILTPPSSNPVSPAPSPDPLDLAIPVRETLILPPRKRCKMILESMESERSSLIASQRQSSVIQFARAS